MFMAFECFIPIMGDDFGAKKGWKYTFKALLAAKAYLYFYSIFNIFVKTNNWKLTIIMKKYNQPQTEIVSVELTNMIMSGSSTPNVDNTGGGGVDPD